MVTGSQRRVVKTDNVYFDDIYENMYRNPPMYGKENPLKGLHLKDPMLHIYINEII